jgi:oxygen-dependent protoporphyrinogen oxidase
MRGKLIFVAGAALGFVLGARAGHDRYDQIADKTSKVWHSRAVQRQVVKAEDFAGAKAVDAVVEGVKFLVTRAFGGGKKKK